MVCRALKPLNSQNDHSNKQIWPNLFYLEEGKPFVSTDNHFKALVVDQGEESRVSQLVRGHWQFLQGHSHRASSCTWGQTPKPTTSKCLTAGNYGHTINLEIHFEKTLITDKNLNREMNIKLT